MADEEGNYVLHTNKPKQKKQSEKTKASTSRAKKPGRGDEKQRLKELETSIRSQVAAEERAHKMVETLVLEDAVTKDFLINSGNLITTSHYADVVEERMLSKKCGYPICNNQINQISPQKYKICMKTNRVYDITERKCFCSNFCFKASKYFESQISASPVWTRIGESSRTCVLLESDSSSIHRTGAGGVLLGKEDEQENTSCEIKDNLSSSSSSSSTQGHDQSPDKPDLLPVKPDQSPDKPDLLPVKLEQLPDKPDQLPDKSDRLPVKPDQLPDKLDQLPDKPDEPDESLKRLPETNDSQKARMRDIEEGSFSRDMIVHSVQTVFQQWCTHSTLEYLGLPVTTGTETKATDPDSFMARAARFFQPASNAKEDSDSDSETGANPETSQEDIVIKEKKTHFQDPVFILPPIDSKSQVTIRRRIVLDKLFRIMPDLLSEIKLTEGDISRDLTELVRTFSLSSKNVALKPFQWKILALSLILILKRKNSLVSQALETSKKDFNALLARLEITRKDIHHMLSPLSSPEAQHPGHFDSPVSDNEAVKTFEFSEEKSEVVFKEREDYGDMEELD
ncbi:RNA polymerase II associated protein 2 [Desmophyllum pertusum]|uniref:RNA polymerase II subunit B1 CTD phosphatase RPAP2 homolog n=1 Tax=Desmophyllum pertusum TaxID=174260 RepID=A0A9X0CGN0_9CNID|nr:RNA polymerase II associated protein 2 [Desmophyllum pertusum]